MLDHQAGGFTAIAPDGKTAYVVGGHGVRIIDISDPKKLVKGAKIDTGVLTEAGGGSAVPIGKNMLLVCGGLGMVLVDVSDIQKPSVVARASSTVSTKEGGAFVTGESGTVRADALSTAPRNAEISRLISYLQSWGSMRTSRPAMGSPWWS